MEVGSSGRITGAGHPAEAVASKHADSKRRAYALFLWIMLVAVVPAPVYFFVTVGSEPVWVYAAGRDPLLKLFALLWSAVYALIAWRTAKWLYTMKSGLRSWVLLAIPISLVLISLLPIYDPVSYRAPVVYGAGSHEAESHGPESHRAERYAADSNIDIIEEIIRVRPELLY